MLAPEGQRLACRLQIEAYDTSESPRGVLEWDSEPK